MGNDDRLLALRGKGQTSGVSVFVQTEGESMKFDWKMEGHCSALYNEAGEKIAFIEKTPRVRVPGPGRYLDYEAGEALYPAPPTWWIYGPKGSPMSFEDGTHESSRLWCEDMLHKLEDGLTAAPRPATFSCKFNRGISYIRVVIEGTEVWISPSEWPHFQRQVSELPSDGEALLDNLRSR
jgi:hypothetical protein